MKEIFATIIIETFCMESGSPAGFENNQGEMKMALTTLYG
jgi:hypothetical protein